MKTMQPIRAIDHSIKNINLETIQNPGFYKKIHANNLTSKNIGQKIYFVHDHCVYCRLLTKLTNTHFTHSSLHDSSKAHVLISYYDFPIYIENNRDKLFDTTVRIILDNNVGNEKPGSVLAFFSNRDLVFYTSKLLE